MYYLKVLAFLYAFCAVGFSYGQVDTGQQEKKENTGNEVGGYVNLFSFDATEILNDPDGNFTWERKGKEFYYRNTMYKIISTRVVNGKTIYKCTFNIRGEYRLIT